MGRDIPLGRFAGIRVSMSWLVPAIGLLYTFSLAQSRFPVEVPNQPVTSYWIVGIAGAILFFVSLLAHEAGHALVGRHEGIGVEGMSLTLLGGLTTFEHEAESAGAELRVALVGPVTTALVGVLFFLLSLALSGGFGLAELFAHLFGWLAFVNLLLAAFNILPASPLDGGKVMSALVWMKTHDQTRAQAVGARIGQVLGVAMLAGGALLVVNYQNINGAFVVLVGLYIFGNATSELKASAGLGILRDVRLTEVMDADPPVLPEWMTVHDLVVNAAAYLPHTAFVVQGIDGRVTGLLTADAVQSTDPALWPSLKLSQLAFPVDRLLMAGHDDSVLVTMQRLRSAPSGRALVLYPDGRIAGVVGPDVARRAAAVHNARVAATARPTPPPPGPPKPVEWGGSPPLQPEWTPPAPTGPPMAPPGP